MVNISIDTLIFNIILPYFIIPLCILLRFLWLKYNDFQIKKLAHIKEHLLEITKIKLENFYWPIYIRLLKINEIETKIKFENTYTNKNINNDDIEINSV